MRILQVHNFVKLSELFYAGSHGMDIKGPANSNHGILFQPPKEFVLMMNNVSSQRLAAHIQTQCLISLFFFLLKVLLKSSMLLFLVRSTKFCWKKQN